MESLHWRHTFARVFNGDTSTPPDHPQALRGGPEFRIWSWSIPKDRIGPEKILIFHSDPKNCNITYNQFLGPKLRLYSRITASHITRLAILDSGGWEGGLYGWDLNKLVRFGLVLDLVLIGLAVSCGVMRWSWFNLGLAKPFCPTQTLTISCPTRYTSTFLKFWHIIIIIIIQHRLWPFHA